MTTDASTRGITAVGEPLPSTTAPGSCISSKSASIPDLRAGCRGGFSAGMSSGPPLEWKQTLIDQSVHRDGNSDFLPQAHHCPALRLELGRPTCGDVTLHRGGSLFRKLVDELHEPGDDIVRQADPV